MTVHVYKHGSEQSRALFPTAFQSPPVIKNNNLSAVISLSNLNAIFGGHFLMIYALKILA